MDVFPYLNSVYYLKSVVVILILVLVISVQFYQYSGKYFALLNFNVKFGSTSFKVDDATNLHNTSTIEKISIMNFADSNSSFIDDGMVKARHNTHMTPKFSGITLSNTTVRKVNNDNKSSPATDTDAEWMETLNYTIDYGDNTCNENKNGNPRKMNFVRQLNHWKSISEKYKIPYFLVYGSLIGAVRNADFIPWDHDMDILVDEIYYETLARIDNNRNFTPKANDNSFHLVVQNFFRSEYSNMHKPRQNCLGQLVPGQSDDCAFNGPMARLLTANIHLDIFHYEVTDDGLLIDREMEYYDQNAMVHKYSDIFPLMRCMYGGVEMRCPNKPRKFLEIAYGKDVMLPNWKCNNTKWIKN